MVRLILRIFLYILYYTILYYTDFLFFFELAEMGLYYALDGDHV